MQTFIILLTSLLGVALCGVAVFSFVTGGKRPGGEKHESELKMLGVTLRGTRQRKLLFPACVDRWVNVANRGDIVALDGDLENDLDKRSTPGRDSFKNFIVISPNDDLCKFL